MATPTSNPSAHPAPEAVPPESDPVAQTIALLQPWIDYVPKQQRRLGLFIFLAFLAHLTMFFFIRIDTTRAELRRQPRPHVTVENMETSPVVGQSSDDFWDRLTDPRLFLLPQQPLATLASDEPAHDFNAPNSDLGTRELPPPAIPVGFQFAHPVVVPLEQRVNDALNPPRQPFVYAESARPIATATTWQWEDALVQRQPAGVAALPLPISDTDLSPTELRVAVNPGGGVEYVLVERSSGRLDLDQLAVLAARKVRFHSTDDSGLLWGGVTIFWHYSATPREEVVPTPTTGT